MKKFLGNIAIDAVIFIVMGSLSAITRCIDFHDAVKRRTDQRKRQAK